jgi:CRP/FNR family transcriptional regulator, cyclic AMP receptor protein
MAESSDFLKSVPIFSGLDSERLSQISLRGSRKFYKRDATVLSENEAGSALFVIISGKVKVSRGIEEGKEIILAILNESDFFGEMAILDGLNRSAGVIAIEETELFIIQRTDFLNLLQEHPEISVALLQELTRRLRISDMKIKSLSLRDAEGKVAVIILQLADDIGTIRQGKVEIDSLPFQYDLANMAGTSRETISRTIHTFVKRGQIELEGNKLTITNYEKFKEMYG